MCACFIYNNMIIIDTTYILVFIPTLQEVVKDLSEMHTNKKTSSTMSHTLIGITPCRIRKFLICSILRSTCMRADAILLVLSTSFLVNWFLVRKGGQYNLTPRCYKSPLICINPLSTITASPSSSGSYSPLFLVIWYWSTPKTRYKNYYSNFVDAN